MSFKITADGSPGAAFTPPIGSATTAEPASCTTELTSAVAMPAIAEAGAAASAASAIFPSRVQIGIPLKFQLVSRKLLELGYCEFEIPHSLRYILRDILKQLAGVTTHAETKRFLKDFIKNIGLQLDKRSLNDTQLAEAIQKFVTTPEITAHFDCSSIHYNQRDQIKASLLKGSELLAQLSPYWDSPLEAALKEHLPEDDSLKVIARLLKKRGMFTGYITNLAEKVAQKLSAFAAGKSLKKQDYNIIVQLIADVLIDDPSIALHERQLPSKLQGPIRTLLEPYHASKKIKNGPHILGPSIDIYFYEGLINAIPMRVSHTEPQGHIPTLLHAFLYRCKQLNDQLDAFELLVGVNKKHLARERAATAVEEEGLTKITGRALSKQFVKEVQKVDKLTSGITTIFHHLSILKNINRRLEEHVTRHISVDLSFIRMSRHLMNLAKEETIEIHNLLTIEVNRNLLSQQALSDEDFLPHEPLSDPSESFSLLSTPFMNHGAAAPQRIPSMERKMQYRRSILESPGNADISTLLLSLERNIGVLNDFQIGAESVVHIAKALNYLLRSDMVEMEENLVREEAAYDERFASLSDEIDPPDAKLSLLFKSAERTFISTPHRSPSATDRTITPSPPPLSAAGGFISSPTLRAYTPSDRLFAGSPPPLACAKALTYEGLPVAVDPPQKSSLGPTGPSSSIACLLTQMLMIRSSTVRKGSALREESTSHLVLAGQDMEQLIKAIQNRDLPLFRAAASLLMIDTHVAIEQHLKAELVGTATDLNDHSLVSLQALLGGEISPEFHRLLEESDLSIMWARYPEKALQVHGHKRRKAPLIHCIERLNSLQGLESVKDQASADAILSQLKNILTQSADLVLGQETLSPLESLLAAPTASAMPFLQKKQNDLDRAIGDIKHTLAELCARPDLDPRSFTSLKEVTHYLDWIEAAENTLQSDTLKASSYWIMRLFIGGVDKLFENLYIGAASFHGHGEIRSHKLISLRSRLFSTSIKSTLSEEEVDHIVGFNIGNGLQYPHQQKNKKSDILLKALNYSLSHIGVEEGFSPVRADMMSDWQQTLRNQVQIALSIWIKEARALFPSEAGAGGSASAAGSGSR